MHALLTQAFTSLADRIESKSMPAVKQLTLDGEWTDQPIGNALFVQKRPHLTRRILLCGHMDTVYGANSCFQTLRLSNPNTLIGPGVADMKGGIVVMLHALQAFEQTPHAHTFGWDVLLTADEEISSPASASLLDSMAKQYAAALVYEPAMTPEGTFAKHRKGIRKKTLIATGRPAHTGRAFGEGRNAICYLAEIILAINALNGQRQGVVINVGKIAGGTALNIVPDKAVAMLEIRVNSEADACWIHARLDQLINSLQRTDYTLTLHSHPGRPVKAINRATNRLFSQIQLAGKMLGTPFTWEDSGGCCDGNNLAVYGMPVIDTLGVRGGKIHTHEEFILLDSLPERAALSLVLLDSLAQGRLEELTA